jgi:hypothetical protein
MDGPFGLAFGLAAGIVAIVPATLILAVAFVYVRQQRGQPVDITTGVSAYTVILIGLGALLVTLGVGQMLTAIAGGDRRRLHIRHAGPRVRGRAPAIGRSGIRRQGSRSSWQGRLRSRCTSGCGMAPGPGPVRPRSGGAWDTLLALLVGLVAVALVAQMFTETFGRAIADDDTSATGRTIAQMAAVVGLWLAYGYRALGHTGCWPRTARAGRVGARRSAIGVGACLGRPATHR